ncbi:Gfo/Idh/MocA family protein [Alkalicoccobacillus porphyridii]|uniref:Gfo/Idh/MocA family oxidoreductase n=1 Tax=Alkalicoccobacillus porphyridii TaxID=2597270 RepID=A0A554A1T4_9BACI|nr:Gfo/Idh/MocA family oxidoreductase [Alkalicoccobacillus porphyridii]TSB47629.1 Gfo/Idh/MocA family oxidoreductase [Alkalicoccobacillus porphyridii]
MGKLKAIQIGVGGFGASWLELLSTNEKIELVAVVDQQSESLQKAMDLTDLGPSHVFTSFQEAIERVEADFVLIVTPPTTHKLLAEQAIKAGLHVMMEKPLTDTTEEAQELLAFTKQYDFKVMVSQNYRWNPQIQTIKQLLAAGSIGTIEYADYYFNKATHFGGWRDQYEEILLQDMAIHHFDILRYLLSDEAVTIQATSSRPSWSWFKGNPHADAAITFSEGVQVHYRGRWAGKGKKTGWNGDIRLVGDKGAIELIDDHVLLYQGEEDTPEEIPLIKTPASDRMISLDAFIQSIIEDTIPPTSIEDNIKSLQLTWAAIKSSKTGERIRL